MRNAILVLEFVFHKEDLDLVSQVEIMNVQGTKDAIKPDLNAVL